MNEIFYIDSFPRSGRRWNIDILLLYFAKLFGVEKELTREHVHDVFAPGERDSRYDIFPRIITGHSGVHHIPKECKGVFLCRNILDTLVSFYYFLHGQMKKGIAEFIDEEFSGLCSHNAWSIRECEKRGLHVMAYETFGEEQTYINLLNYFGFVPVDLDALKYAIDNSKFEIMHARERKDHPECPLERMRIRKGKIEGYKDYLNRNQINKYKKLCHSVCSKNDIRILERFNLLRF